MTKKENIFRLWFKKKFNGNESFNKKPAEIWRLLKSDMPDFDISFGFVNSKLKEIDNEINTFGKIKAIEISENGHDKMKNVNVNITKNVRMLTKRLRKTLAFFNSLFQIYNYCSEFSIFNLGAY